jgi:hypothetical protein
MHSLSLVLLGFRFPEDCQMMMTFLFWEWPQVTTPNNPVEDL